MAWQSLKIEADADNAETLSDALMELGALSVGIEDADAETPDELPIFGEPGIGEPGVWRRNVVSALFDDGLNLDEIALEAASAAGIAQPRFTIEAVPEQDWVRATQSQFDPIHIAGKMWIVPSWHDSPEPDAINIILDPGLAFGTGSHPTTHLCLAWLTDHLKAGESVLDYGCGSGILAIAAKKLGAGATAGVDIDPQAILSSRQNAEQNGVEADFYLPDELPATEADVIVANILSIPLKVLAPALAQACRPGGRIALSGILAEQAEDVSAVYAAWFDMAPPVFMENWTLLTGTKR
ncbi:ribosomal protein L11 methyltransferase [Novimethylophilus kurashikiensis]|uniref:Ribosomal protein L11 methyltransferase n=1 Tax=Novimethylophilus kurashikiensis TaxID=1825523 RepID=A0A2R5F8T0_9PROT|nr:50S ribosomal protein L11 methyltransferase [Novimethylophilus kurashikiensis]GBG13948.1 ribosomal protein L11 methyltransferase [Novimethylophilus kurashikiensis]